MKKVLTLFLAILGLLNLNELLAQNEYAANKIPPGLSKDANVVIRHYGSSFVLENESHAKETIQFTLTVLNKNGLEYARLYQFYDKFSKIGKIKGKVYDKNGELIRSIKREDIEDVSAMADYSLYDESRVILVDPKYRTFPFTVEFSYEIDYTGLMEYPDWSPFFGYGVSAGLVEYSITCPENMKVRFLTQNTDKEPKSEVVENNTVYTWSYENFAALTREDYSVNLSSSIPKVVVAPVSFDIDGYKGDFSSWKNFGLWIKQLNDENNKFSEASRNEVLKVVEGVTDDHEKVRLLYKYLQSKVRYVNITLGIGGWQPFPPETVHQVSYGDCKALTFYMQTLLKTAGINSIYTLVQAGENPAEIHPDFPESKFNHVVLCVPERSDTLWLECTSQELPAGFLSTFTDGRKALLITGKGGMVATIPSYSEKENRQTNKTTVKINEDLSAEIDVKYHFTGFYYTKLLRVLSQDNVEKKRYVTGNLKLPGYELKNFNFADDRSSELPVITGELKLSLFNTCTELRDKYLLPLNVMNEDAPIPGKSRERFSDICIRRPYQTIDTTVFQIPENFSIDFLPKPVSVESPYGSFKTDIESTNNEIVYIRTLVVRKGLYPKSEYEDFVGFFETINESSNPKCVLKKKVE